MDVLTAKTYFFSEFEINGAKRLLLKLGEPLALNPKAFEMLFVLVENHGQVVSKDELLEKVWAGQFVEENNLTVHISALRKIFGEKKGKHQFILTISGTGYSFIHEVRQDAGNALVKINISDDFDERERLIGRDAEIAEIKSILRASNKCLLTLSGAGGSGKTVLAQEIAAELNIDFADGVFFVELAAASEANFVVSAIANTLGITEAGGKSLVETVKDFLRTRKILLILDNFEQVLSAAPLVKEFLADSAQLKILVTSRALLHLNIEREFPVQPLDSPPPNAAFSIEKLNEFPAVELFKTRAQNVRPNFALTSENIKTVAEICRCLDGLPLAIELAAARVKLLAPQAILERLEHSLQLLTAGAINAPERQRTMRDTIRWSYDLLKTDEQFLFRRLAIFAGGFSVEAAESVGEREIGRKGEREKSQQEKMLLPENNLPVSPSPRLPFSSSVLDLLSSLIDSNLLVSKEQTDSNVRLQMLEVVREFALECLENTGEEESVRRIHSDFFRALAEEAEPLLNGERGNEWLEKLETEHDNLRSALSWSLKNDGETAAKIAAALRNFWINHSHLGECLRWSKAALQATENMLSEARLKLLMASGYVLRSRGEFEAAQKSYEKGLTESQKLNNSLQICANYQGLGAVAVLQKDYPAAQTFYRKALNLSRATNEETGISYLLNSLVDLEMCQGNWSAARLLVEESLTLSKKLDNKRILMTIYFNLGTIDYYENLYEKAALSFAESLRIAGEMNNKTFVSYALDGFAALAAIGGKPEQSAKLAGAADNLREEIGYKNEPAEEIFRTEYLTKTRAALNEKQFSALYLQGQNLNSDEAVALVFQKQLAGQDDFADENFSEIIIESHKFERITIDEKIIPDEII